MFNQVQSTVFANIGGNYDLTPIIPKMHDRDVAIISAFKRGGYSMIMYVRTLGYTIREIVIS